MQGKILRLALCLSLGPSVQWRLHSTSVFVDSSSTHDDLRLTTTGVEQPMYCVS